MLNLKRLGAALFLICVLGLTAWGDCPAPGIIGGPPCSMAPLTLPTDSTTPAITEDPPVSEAPLVELPSLAEFVLNALNLF